MWIRRIFVSIIVAACATSAVVVPMTAVDHGPSHSEARKILIR